MKTVFQFTAVIVVTAAMMALAAFVLGPLQWIEDRRARKAERQYLRHL